MALVDLHSLQGLLLPGAVAAVAGLCVLYLIWRLFVSSSANKGQKGGNKKKNASKPKRPAPAKKKPASTLVAPTPATVEVPASSSESESTESTPEVTKRVAAPKQAETKQKKEGKKKRRKVERVPSAENIADFLPIDITKEKNEPKTEAKAKVTGKDKIAAAKTEPLAEGWEIVGLKKKEWKDAKKKEREEVEKAQKEKEEKEGVTSTENQDKDKKGRKRERREGRDENSDKKPREPRSDKGPRGPRTGDRKRKNEKPEEKEKPAPAVVSEKTKRREEIKINGILFSKFKDGEEEIDEVWDQLSEIIQNGRSASDDLTPLCSAHLEMRYFSRPKDTPIPKKRVVSAEASGQGEWSSAAASELSKYNYTQSKKEDKVDEGPSELHTPAPRVWDLNDEEVHGKVDELTADLLEAFIKALGHPYTSNLAKVELSATGKPQRFLVQTDVDSLRTRLLKLLSSGVSLEPPVCDSQSEAAEFVDKLLQYLSSNKFVCYTNNSASRGSKFWKKGFGDEGFFIVTPDRIVMLWFIGYD